MKAHFISYLIIKNIMLKKNIIIALIISTITFLISLSSPLSAIISPSAWIISFLLANIVTSSEVTYLTYRLSFYIATFIYFLIAISLIRYCYYKILNSNTIGIKIGFIFILLLPILFHILSLLFLKGISSNPAG